MFLYLPKDERLFAVTLDGDQMHAEVVGFQVGTEAIGIKPVDTRRHQEVTAVAVTREAGQALAGDCDKTERGRDGDEVTTVVAVTAGDNPGRHWPATVTRQRGGGMGTK